MPTFIESEIPEIAGRAELDFGQQPLRGLEGSLGFIAAGGSNVMLFDEPTESNQVLLEQTQPIWQQTDQAFRQLHRIRGECEVTHKLLIINNATTKLTFLNLRRDGILPATIPLRPGFVHVDGQVKSPKVSEKYTYHPESSTEFFLGNRWFLPFNTQSYRFLPITTLGTLMNLPFLRMQAHYSIPFQPLGGTIVRVGETVHRAPRRVYSVDGSEKFITDYVSVADVV